MAEDVLLPLAKNIHRLPFETRKDAQIIFSSLFRYRQPESRNPEPPVLQYVINQRPDIIIALCNGYDHKESAMPCGGVLREAMKHDSVSALILYDEPTENGKSRGLGGVDPNVRSTGRGIFWKFFEWIDKGAFEVSADAFSTFRVGHVVTSSIDIANVLRTRKSSPSTRGLLHIIFWSTSTFSSRHTMKS
jgi:calcium binding protein 39